MAKTQFHENETFDDSEDEFFQGRDEILLSPKRRKLDSDSEEEVLAYNDWDDYYDADVIETEADALEEEAEARRLQQKQLQSITADDFGLDNWVADGPVIEKLPEPKLPANATLQDKLDLLHLRYPEFEPLAKDLQTPPPPADSIQGQAFSAYIGTIAMYFALLTTKVDLRTHPVISMLVRTRQAWYAVRDDHSQEKSVERSRLRKR